MRYRNPGDSCATYVVIGARPAAPSRPASGRARPRRAVARGARVVGRPSIAPVSWAPKPSTSSTCRATRFSGKPGRRASGAPPVNRLLSVANGSGPWSSIGRSSMPPLAARLAQASSSGALVAPKRSGRPEGVVTIRARRARDRARVCVGVRRTLPVPSAAWTRLADVFLQSAQLETPFPSRPDIEVRFGREVAPDGFAWLVPFTATARRTLESA